MDTNKILSADFIDLLFDNRNKEYGAYELRKTYQSRLTRSLIFTGVLVGLTFTGLAFINKSDPKEKCLFFIPDVIIDNIDPFKKEPELIADPPMKRKPVQIQTTQFTRITIADNVEEIQTPPTHEDLVNSKIGDENNVGIIDEGLINTDKIDRDKKIIEEKVTTGPEIVTNVDIDAKFEGNWQKFLVRNLNPQTPIDNNAPAGNYTVIMQFVVDIDGTVSDIKALSNLGFGLEQEAIRVLKKATKWEPAIQNGRKVKAYRKQAITFQVTEE